MTSMQWWRCKHGAPFDPKWRVIAQQAKTEPGKVWAVVTALYDRASQAADRGNVAGAGLDDIAEGFGWPLEEVQRIYSGLKAKAVIIDNRIATWEKHQPKREREKDSSTERTRRYRERLKLASQDVTKPAVTVTPPVTVRDGHVTAVTDVTESAPSQVPAKAQPQANLVTPRDAPVTPRDAQSREDRTKIEELECSSSETIGSMERVGVASDPPPPLPAKPKPKKGGHIQALADDESDAGAMASYWNDLAKEFGLPQVKFMSPTRRQKIDARIKDFGGRDRFASAVLEQIPHQPFLLGRNDRCWKVDLDWVLEPRNAVKISEGKYTNGHA